MKALVIGYGSIGLRHARILAELGCQVAVVSAREIVDHPCFHSVADAVPAFGPDYAVVAGVTSQHAEDARELAAAGFRGILLVEKPLFHTIEDLPFERFRHVFVAYNLRFHPLLQRLSEIVRKEKVISVQAYVGQYLPLWRPGRDYRAVYSADKALGGGVLRDLSHELDLLSWLFGGWRKLTAVGGHYSNLEIDSEDTFDIVMATEHCPVINVQMNYLDRVGRRCIIINTAGQTIVADLVAGRLMLNDRYEDFPVDRNHTYRGMHTAVLDDNHHDLCSYAEGLQVVEMIVAAEQAVQEERWIKR